MDPENHISENDPEPDTHREPDTQASQSNPDIPRTPSTPAPPPPKTHYEITCKTENNFWDHVKTGAELLGIVLLAVYTGYTIKMYCANKKAADAAKSAADTASDSLKFSREQFRTDERPYMSPAARGANTDGQGHFSVYNIGTGPATGEVRLGVSVEITNVGKSPAVEMMATRTEYKVGPWRKARQETASFRPSYPTDKGTEIVFAGTGVTAQSGGKIITTAEWEKLKNGDWEFYVVGGIRYRDMFIPAIEPYETTYCYHVLTMSVESGGLPFASCGFPPPNFGNSIK